MDEIKKNYSSKEVLTPPELTRETTADYSDVFWTAGELAAFDTLDQARNREGVTLRVINKKFSQINQVSGCRFVRPKKKKKVKKTTVKKRSAKKRKSVDADDDLPVLSRSTVPDETQTPDKKKIKTETAE